MAVRHIKADGTMTTVAPANGKEFTLKELQALVGGLIEFVQVDSVRGMWVNEEGLLSANPQVNHEASMIAGFTIVGDVVFGTPKEIGAV